MDLSPDIVKYENELAVRFRNNPGGLADFVIHGKLPPDPDRASFFSRIAATALLFGGLSSTAVVPVHADIRTTDLDDPNRQHVIDTDFTPPDSGMRFGSAATVAADRVVIEDNFPDTSMIIPAEQPQAAAFIRESPDTKITEPAVVSKPTDLVAAESGVTELSETLETFWSKPVPDTYFSDVKDQTFIELGNWNDIPDLGISFSDIFTNTPKSGQDTDAPLPTTPPAQEKPAKSDKVLLDEHGIPYVMFGKDRFYMPLRTDMDKLKKHSPKWNYKTKNNIHHDYNATDQFTDPGTIVESPVDGTAVVVHDHDDSVMGSRVTIKSKKGKRIFYLAHMAEGSIQVKQGDTVYGGRTVIGKTGVKSESQNTWPHLHTDVQEKGAQNRPFCGGRDCLQYDFLNIQDPQSRAFAATDAWQDANPNWLEYYKDAAPSVPDEPAAKQADPTVPEGLLPQLPSGDDPLFSDPQILTEAPGNIFEKLLSPVLEEIPRFEIPGLSDIPGWGSNEPDTSGGDGGWGDNTGGEDPGNNQNDNSGDPGVDEGADSNGNGNGNGEKVEKDKGKDKTNDNGNGNGKDKNSDGGNADSGNADPNGNANQNGNDNSNGNGNGNDQNTDKQPENPDTQPADPADPQNGVGFFDTELPDEGYFEDVEGEDMNEIFAQSAMNEDVFGSDGGGEDSQQDNEHSDLGEGMPEIADKITIDVVKEMMPDARSEAVESCYEPIMKALRKHGIATKHMVLYAFATVPVETGITVKGKNMTCMPVRELGRGHGRYKTKNGNYYGRGYIQLTWEGNYRAVGKKIGIDLVKHPDKALDPDVAAEVLAIFLSSEGRDKKITRALKRGDFDAARRVVNGGTNGVRPFQGSFERGLNAMK